MGLFDEPSLILSDSCNEANNSGEWLFWLAAKTPTTLWCRHHALYVAVIIHNLECNALFFFSLFSLELELWFLFAAYRSKSWSFYEGKSILDGSRGTASSYFYILLHKFLQPRASPRWNNYFFSCSSWWLSCRKVKVLIVHLLLTSGAWVVQLLKCILGNLPGVNMKGWASTVS